MKQNKHALREQAESWGDKVAVCWWYGQSYGVSSWWTTERRQHIPDRGQAKTRAETAEKTSVDHNEVVGFRWICIYLCFEVIRCDIAWYIAICRDIILHIMRYHKIRYIEILYPYLEFLGLMSRIVSRRNISRYRTLSSTCQRMLPTHTGVHVRVLVQETLRARVPLLVLAVPFLALCLLLVSARRSEPETTSPTYYQILPTMLQFPLP